METAHCISREKIIIPEGDVLCLQRIIVNEGFGHCDRIFVTTHPDILNCNKDDEQHTVFYFNE